MPHHPRPTLGRSRHIELDESRVALRGDVDTALSLRLGDALAEAAAAGDPVVVDASDLDVLDVAAARALGRIARRAEVVVTRPSSTVRTVLEIVGLGHLVGDDPSPLGVDARAADRPAET